MCISQTCIRDWAIYCSSKNTSALIRWNKIMPQRWKWVLKIFSNVVFNLLLPCMNTHAGLNSTALWMQMTPLPALPTSEIPHRGSRFKFLPVWGDTSQVSIYSRAGCCQLPSILFPIPNGFVMLSWPVPRWQAPRSMLHGVYKELEAVPPGLGLGIGSATSKMVGKSSAKMHVVWWYLLVSSILAAPESWYMNVHRAKDRWAGYTASGDMGEPDPGMHRHKQQKGL